MSESRILADYTDYADFRDSGDLSGYCLLRRGICNFFVDRGARDLSGLGSYVFRWVQKNRLSVLRIALVPIFRKRETPPNTLK